MSSGDKRVGKKPIDNILDGGWVAFRNGRWTRQPPTSEGLYPIANLDGGFRGYCEIYPGVGGALLYRVRDRTSTEPEHVHGGFWWSRAVPPLKAAPDLINEGGPW